MTSMRKSFDDLIGDLRRAGLSPETLYPGRGLLTFDSVTPDSRQVQDHSVFCAISGLTHDGHRHVAELKGKSALILIEKSDLDLKIEDFNAAVVRVSSTRAAWSVIAASFCDNPQEHLKFIGVTGTNGKTSTVWFLKEIFRLLDVPLATIGTLGCFLGADHFETRHTTPDPDELFGFLAEARRRGIGFVAMEVSSHSLVQEKLRPILFDAVGFTSFSQDHLDFHASMDDYLDAKLRLLAPGKLKSGVRPILHGSLLALENVGRHRKRYGYSPISYGFSADFEVVLTADIDLGRGYSRISVSSSGLHHNFYLPVAGAVFCENAACALLIASQSLGLDLSHLSARMSGALVRPVPGRLEPISSPTAFPCAPSVFVDYAHTPDALEKAIKSLKKSGRTVVSVFGCGGDRDKSKRPIMGEIACRESRAVFVTSDNPRTETPEDIVRDIVSGCRTPVNAVVDRKSAIDAAIAAAHFREAVLIAGKGHEEYQIIGNQKFYFSDQDVAFSALSQKLRWLVVGAGASGVSAANFLAFSRQSVSLCDDLAPSRPSDLDAAVEWLGKFTGAVSDFQRIVIGPGVPLSHPICVRARGSGLCLLTEIDLGLSPFNGKTVAVTGTNGKSTTVALTDFLLRRAGFDSVACGNIGVPPTSLGLATYSERAHCVVELSSYQLEGCFPHKAAAVAITSFSNDHLARHKTLDEYFRCKWNITSWLDATGVLILSQDVSRFALDHGFSWPETRTVVIGAGARPDGLPDHAEYFDVSQDTLAFSGMTLDWSALKCPGTHQRFNALAALSAVTHLHPEVPVSSWASNIPAYKPLPYRCEVVFERPEFRVVNDSKSTNVESTLAALSMAARPAILLMGGQGKGEPYQPVAHAASKVALLITFGASGDAISSEVSGSLPTETFATMKDAVARGLELCDAKRLDLIFSPGCASFDEFRNFEHRGAEFSKLVQEFFSKSNGLRNP